MDWCEAYLCKGGDIKGLYIYVLLQAHFLFQHKPTGSFFAMQNPKWQKYPAYISYPHAR